TVIVTKGSLPRQEMLRYECLHAGTCGCCCVGGKQVPPQPCDIWDAGDQIDATEVHGGGRPRQGDVRKRWGLRPWVRSVCFQSECRRITGPGVDEKKTT